MCLFLSPTQHIYNIYITQKERGTFSVCQQWIWMKRMISKCQGSLYINKMTYGWNQWLFMHPLPPPTCTDWWQWLLYVIILLYFSIIFRATNQYSTEKWHADANTIYFSAYLLTRLNNLLVWIYRQFSNYTVHNLKTEKVFIHPNTQKSPVYIYFEYTYCQFSKVSFENWDD